MKLYFTIAELAEILEDDIRQVANGLLASGVPLTWRGKVADLSGWTGGMKMDGEEIFINSSYFPNPDPCEVLVSTDALPESWKNAIESHPSLPILKNTNLAVEVAKTEIPADIPTDPPANSVTKGKSKKQPFIPRIGWHIAVFDAWPKIKLLHPGRDPTINEVIAYLKKFDTSGYILNKGTETELWWKTVRNETKLVPLKTIANLLTKLR